jgi:hypothetical protein
MKIILIVAILLIAAFLAYWFVFHESAPARSYREHRAAMAAAEGFTEQNSHRQRWSLTIDSCEIKGLEAHITATEEEMVLPENSASFVFANIVTRKLGADMLNQNGTWQVSVENVLSEDFSTFDDRKNKPR